VKINQFNRLRLRQGPGIIYIFSKISIKFDIDNCSCHPSIELTIFENVYIYGNDSSFPLDIREGTTAYQSAATTYQSAATMYQSAATTYQSAATDYTLVL